MPTLTLQHPPQLTDEDHEARVIASIATDLLWGAVTELEPGDCSFDFADYLGRVRFGLAGYALPDERFERPWAICEA